MERSESLLEELRKFSKPYGSAAFLEDSEYIMKYQDYKEVVMPKNEYPNKMKLFFDKIRLAVSRSNDSIFRICSLGCGDGLVDNDILSTVTKENPDLHIQYVGIDLSPTYCKMAKDNLKPEWNVEVKILNQSFLDYYSDEPFDFIIAMHSLYYLPSPEEGIKKFLSLVKSTGLVVVSLRSDDALHKPHGALCHPEEGVNFCYSDVLAEAMDNLGVQYEHHTYSYVMNLTQGLKENFQSPVQKNVLDFIAQIPLELYPEGATKTLISYLDSICYGQPDKALLDITVDSFCISKQ